MDKSKVVNCKFGGVDADSTSSSIQCRSTTEKFVTIKQSKYPVLPFARMLDDESSDQSWLSGSELKTDNSTSEDEEVRGSFVEGTKTRIRSKGKKRISSIRKVMTFSSSSSTTSSYQRMTSTSSAGSKKDLGQELVTATRSLWTSRRSADGQASQITEDLDEKKWRPKRGSISLLPGLTEQIEAP